MKRQIVLPEKDLDIRCTSDLAILATLVKRFIVKENLFTKIKNKNYANVEGWQFAGALLGIFPEVVMIEKIEGKEEEIKYKAEVVLNNIKTEKVVGRGFAICSNIEANRVKESARTKEPVDEFVIASMAQTRAIGKSFRNSFAWIMKLAGYEPTPSEEMELEKTIIFKDETEPASEGILKNIKNMADAKKIEINLNEIKTMQEAREKLKEIVGVKNG